MGQIHEGAEGAQLHAPDQLTLKAMTKKGRKEPES